jgi:dihydrofolate reductase
MGKVIFGMTMSLDGFINDRNGSVSRLYPDMQAMRESELLQEAMHDTGAVVMGRRSYDMGNGDYTGYEFQVPIFVVTHHPPAQAARGENDRLSFTFVSEGYESAIAQAKAAAGEKDVTIVGGADAAQQCLKAGLIDELQLDIRHVLLGGGLRLFENLGLTPIELESTRVVNEKDVTHLFFRVMK